MATHHKSDAEIIATTHNIARFFTEHRQVALVLLMATFVWGFFGYRNMPKRKDPNIPVRVASAQCQWPGATAEQVEQLVTRPIEQTVALNTTLKPPSPSDFGIRSISFPGLAVVYIQLNDNVKDKEKQFSDMNLKLNQLSSAAGRRADPVQQQLRRHRGADAHRGQPHGRPNRSRAAGNRHTESHRDHARRTTKKRSAAASQRHLRISAVRRAWSGSQRL